MSKCKVCEKNGDSLRPDLQFDDARSAFYTGESDCCEACGVLIEPEWPGDIRDAKEALRRWQAIAERHRSGTAEVDYVVLRNAADEIERLQTIVDGAEAAREDYVVEYGWNNDKNQMGYWHGPRGSFASDRLTWAGTSRRDAWLAIGKTIAEKARAT